MARHKDVSIDMYHRIYRLAVRKVPADQIAITLDLPINTVRSIIEQFFSHNKTTPNEKAVSASKKDTSPSRQSYLDIYVLQRLRISVVDINGMVTENHKDVIESELNKILNSDLRLVALLMANVKAIDETGFSSLLTFHEQFTAKGRYSAILDPSRATEAFIEKNELESKIPVFGTEKTFEENALKTKKKK